jgi:hypothetical protein
MSDAPDNPKPFRLQSGDAFGISDAGERVAIAWPQCNEPPEIELLGLLKESGAVFRDEAAALEIIRAADLQRQGRPEIILKLVAFLTNGRTYEQAGQLAFVLAFVLKLPVCRTQSDLAAKLGMTQGRVSQLINEIGKSFDEH